MEKEISHDTLYTFLKDKYNGRVGDMPALGFKGSIFTSLDGKKFSIIYGQSNMLLSTGIETKEVIDELEIPLSEYMKSTPICSYNLLCKNNDEIFVIPSIEWETDNPSARLKLIVNNNAFEEALIDNIKILNGKDINDYIEPSKVLKKK